MLYSPGGGMFHCKVVHTVCCSPQSVRTVLCCPGQRRPPNTSAEPGESQPGGGRAADLGDWSDRGPACVHPPPEKMKQLSFSLSDLVPVARFLRSPVSSFQLFVQSAARTQQSDSRVAPSGSTCSEPPLQLHEAANCVNLPAANEPAFVHTANWIL